MRSSWSEEGRPADGRLDSDRGCPLDTEIDLSVWHTNGTRRAVWLVPTYNGRLNGHRPARVCSGHLFVPGSCRWARTDSQSNTAKPTRAATIGAPTHSTNPAPMLAPMTPAVKTRHPAPHSAPARISSANTGHQRRSKRPARPACISATTAAAARTAALTPATCSVVCPMSKAGSGSRDLGGQSTDHRPPPHSPTDASGRRLHIWAGRAGGRHEHQHSQRGSA